jgi:hypothetical protein
MWTDPEQVHSNGGLVCHAMYVPCLVKADWHELQTVAPLALFWLGEKAHSNYEIFCCSMYLFYDSFCCLCSGEE